MPVLESAELTSTDGTRLRFRTLGEGPPLVIAHGAFATSDDFVPVAVRLASCHRVVLLDRRGYRDSATGPSPASFAQDGDDLVALMRAVGPPCALFGHGAGALAAMHAARAASGLVRALALFEPPLHLTGPARRPLLERYRQLREAGQDGAALVAFTWGTTPVPEEDVVRRWIDAPGLTPRPADVAAGVGRDLEALVGFRPDLEPWRALTPPVTLLVAGHPGGRAADPCVASARRLAGVLSEARTVVLAPPRRLHLLDPELLVRAVRAAFDDPGPGQDLAS